jgi:hypothetical protein
VVLSGSQGGVECPCARLDDTHSGGPLQGDELVDAARRHEAPDPIVWERARPEDPDVPNLGKRLLRMISTRIQQRAALDAARVADPPADVSATAGAESTREGVRGA